MANTNRRLELRLRRKRSIRKRVQGTAERPRLMVFRSLKHIYASVIDDTAKDGNGATLVQVSSLHKELRDQAGDLKKSEMAAKVGELAAKACLEKGIDKVVFDRNGFLYHGRVSAMADGARKAGLNF